MPGESCEKCKWFVVCDTLEFHDGFCTRYPPVPVVLEESEVINVNPHVMKAGMCGEFQL